jgi:hypothetical protein
MEKETQPIYILGSPAPEGTHGNSKRKGKGVAFARAKGIALSTTWLNLTMMHVLSKGSGRRIRDGRHLPFLKLFSSNKEIVDLCSEYTMWSWSAQKSVDPLVIAKAEGIYTWDAEGKRYIDWNSQLMW